MKDLYENTNRPVNQYASKVQSLKSNCVRLIEALQKDLKIAVPPNVLTILKTRVSDTQSPMIASQIVPRQVQSRLRPSQHGATGSRSSPGPSPAQSARDRARSRLRGNN